jgi:hypothetical protein
MYWRAAPSFQIVVFDSKKCIALYDPARRQWAKFTDISQYRLRFGFSLLYKSVFHLNRLTAQLSYEGRAAVEGGN